jgi:hypothetical protein
MFMARACLTPFFMIAGTDAPSLSEISKSTSAAPRQIPQVKQHVLHQSAAAGEKLDGFAVKAAVIPQKMLYTTVRVRTKLISTVR